MAKFAPKRAVGGLKKVKGVARQVTQAAAQGAQQAASQAANAAGGISAEELLDNALRMQQGAVLPHLRRLQRWTAPQGANARGAALRRRGLRDGSPVAALMLADKQFVQAVSAVGASTGGAAAVPGVGTASSVALTAADVSTFVGACAQLLGVYSAVHGADWRDIERQKTLLYGVMLGDAGASLINKVAGRTGPYWGRGLVDSVPTSTLRAVNKRMGQHFVVKFGTKKGLIRLGSLLPFGVGAAIGGAGNYALGRSVLTAVHEAFGPAPMVWPQGLEPDWNERSVSEPTVTMRRQDGGVNAPTSGVDEAVVNEGQMRVDEIVDVEFYDVEEVEEGGK